MESKDGTKVSPAVGIEFDSEAQAKLSVPLGQRELYPYGGMKIAEAMKEHGITVAFGAPGGHIWTIIDAISRIGIKTVTVGHEQNGVYAAEAYAQVSGKPAVAYVTAGPGMTNCVSGIQQAWLSQTPIILLAGAHPADDDGWYLDLQEAYGGSIVASMTKQQIREMYPWSAKAHFAHLYQLSNIAPRGPVIMELTQGLVFTEEEAGKHYFFGANYKKDSKYKVNWRREKTPESISAGAGNPEDIAEAVQRINEANAPFLMFGDGPVWSQAGPELEELCNLLKVPFSTRRLARGLVSDDHPYYFRGVAPYVKECDLLVSWGIKINYFDNFGKGWPEIIQISEAAAHVWTFVDTPLAIVGDLKQVAKQMINYVKANNIQPPPGRDAWLAGLRQQQGARRLALKERAMYYGFEHPRYRTNDVMHYAYLCQATQQYLEEHYQSRARVTIDGFTVSDYAVQFLKATRGAQMIASSEMGGVGHGLGMAIGAMVAQFEQGDRTPILALMGDSGMGNAGGDLDVAVRYKMPIVFQVTNNGGWMPGMKYVYYGENWEALGEQDRTGADWHGAAGTGQERAPISWAKVGEGFGCYAETVRRHEDYLPALHRCFQAAEKGQPAVLDCIMDPMLVNRKVTSGSYAAGFVHIPYHELTNRGKALRRNTLSWWRPALNNEPQMPMPDPWEPLTDEEKEI